MKPRRLSPPGSEMMVSRFLQEQPHMGPGGDCSGSPHAPRDPLSPGSQTLPAAEPLPCTLGRKKPAQSKRGEGLLGVGGPGPPQRSLAPAARLCVEQSGSAAVTALCCCCSGICVPETELLLCSSITRQVQLEQSPAVLES